MYKFDREKYDKRMQWFTHDRFGMFIHWGLYAIPARGEWVRSTEEIPEEDYIPFFNEFNPKDFDPKKWARLAKQAGMKYAVLTAAADGADLVKRFNREHQAAVVHFGKFALCRNMHAKRRCGRVLHIHQRAHSAHARL